MNFKKFLPFENYLLMTRLPVEEVLKRIGDNTQEKRGLNISSFNRKFSKPYSGQILGSTFTIHRNINYRNSFLPVITGQVDSFLGKTQVGIKMRLLLPVLIFISFWLGAVGLASIFFIINAISGSEEIFADGLEMLALVPVAMFVFGCLLTYFAFKTESNNSKKFLADLLEGEKE